jgi:hypothetical protein
LLRHSSPIVREKYYSRLSTRTIKAVTDTISRQLIRATSGETVKVTVTLIGAFRPIPNNVAIR